MGSRSSKEIVYHFEITYDDKARKWILLENFDGIPLQPIRDDGRWRSPIIPSEENKLKRRRRELTEALNAMNEAANATLSPVNSANEPEPLA